MLAALLYCSSTPRCKAVAVGGFSATPLLHCKAAGRRWQKCCACVVEGQGGKRKRKLNNSKKVYRNLVNSLELLSLRLRLPPCLLTAQAQHSHRTGPAAQQPCSATGSQHHGTAELHHKSLLSSLGCGLAAKVSPSAGRCWLPVALLPLLDFRLPNRRTGVSSYV